MRRMKRRNLLRLSLALLLFGSLQALAQPRFEPTPQDQADLARIETYLDSLRTLKAHFLQVAPNGAISQGNRLAGSARPHAVPVRSRPARCCWWPATAWSCFTTGH